MKKTTPSGRGQSATALPVERLIATPVRVVPTTTKQEKSNEPIQKAITYTLALSVPYCLGSKIPIQDSYREGSDGSREMYQSIL